MKEPGSISQPIISEKGIHIFYYLADRDGGAVAYSDEAAEVIRQSLYNTELSTRLSALRTELANAAEIVSAEEKHE